VRFDRLERYRPTRTGDGEGGWLTTYGDAYALYGAIRVHENTTTLIFRDGEDVKPEDIIAAGGVYYRVTGAAGPEGAPALQAPLERTERPIVPR